MIYSATVLPRRPILPFSRPEIGEEEIAAVVDCLRSGWITSKVLPEVCAGDVVTVRRERGPLIGARDAGHQLLQTFSNSSCMASCK